MWAAFKNNIKVVRLLLNSGVNINKEDKFNDNALDYAEYKNNIKIVDLLLNAGIDFNKQNYFGDTVLIKATLSRNIEIVKLLLNAGVLIDKKNDKGNTALIVAASHNSREIIELLLDYGADEFILDRNNKSFYYHLSDFNKQYFLQNYPTSVYNAISHNYKKSFTEFVKDYNIKK